MPGKPLGKRIEEWMANLPVVGKLAKWIIDWQNRRKAISMELNEALVKAVQAGEYEAIPSIILQAMLHQTTGDVPFLGDVFDKAFFANRAEIDAFIEDPQSFLESGIEKAFGHPSTRKFTEFVGTIITDPVLNLFEQYATDPSPDPHDFARSFHGIASGLPWVSGVVDSVFQLALGKRAPQPGKHIMSLYWGLGMGFLGWQTLAPLLSSGLQPNLERYYNKLYRPARFTPAQASDLFALGEWSADKMKTYLQELGWPDGEIETWIRLSYRTLSEGALWDLYDAGQINKTEMDHRLRAQGYDPGDIPLLYKYHEPEEKEEAKRFLISTVKNAFKSGRMSEAEFRAILSEQNYQDRIIDLLVDELSFQAEEEQRELSETNIRLLYNNRVIGRDEAIHYLTELDYTSEIAGQLIKAWDNQALPKPARINKGTILEGYTDGVLSRDQAADLLRREAGYSSENAELILKIEEAGRPTEAAPSVAAASLGMISAWVEYGLISRSEVEGRAELERFNPDDRERIVDLMFLQPPSAVEAVQLDVAIIEQAYVFGAITREDLAGRLSARGLVDEDVELQIRTLELAYPEVFGEFPTVYLKQPGVSSIQLALQRGLIDEEGFRSRLQAQGYTLDAIEILLFNAQYQLPPDPKQPTKADLLDWFKDGVISRAEFVRRMTGAGYLATDIELYLKSLSLTLLDTVAADLFLQGYLDLNGFIALATQMGYTTEEIEDFLGQFEG